MNWWKPELYQRKITFLQERQKIIKSIRNYFDEQGFFEIETPSLQISPGLEVHLKAFKTSLEEPFYDKTKTLYLHTSPEFSMKKLLVAGLPKIYQICHVYRNAERSDRHHPEFTMIEWYRANDDYLSIMEDCKKLIRNATKNLGKNILSYKGSFCDPFKDWEMLTIQNAFLKYANIDVLATIDNPDNPDPNPQKLIKEAKRPIKVLNLFAYTGGASVVCSKAGALVTHVDASKGMVERAKENASINNITNIRFIIDDCKKFIEREIRRGNFYDAIIMDPPSYGRGTNGEMWKLEDNLFDFVMLTKKVLSNNPLFVLISSYTTGLQASVLANILTLVFGKGNINADEIGLPAGDIVLPCGCRGLKIWKN